MGPPPEQAFVVGDGQQFGQGVTEQKIIARLRKGISGFEQAQDGLNSEQGFLGRIVSGLTGGRHRDLKGAGDYFDSIRDGQLDISNRTDLLSPLLDYGSAYMNAVTPIANPITLPFTNQVGPMRGCELAGGRIRLLDKGLWDVRCQVWFNGVGAIQTSTVNWEIRVLRPDTSLYSVTAATFSSDQRTSSTNVASVVVPEAGYLVEAYVSFIASGRVVDGGPSRNRLTVQHISRDTATGDTGQS